MLHFDSFLLNSKLWKSVKIPELGFQDSGTVRAPVFGRHQFFGTSEHYGKAHGSLLSA